MQRLGRWWWWAAAASTWVVSVSVRLLIRCGPAAMEVFVGNSRFGLMEVMVVFVRKSQLVETMVVFDGSKVFVRKGRFGASHRASIRRSRCGLARLVACRPTIIDGFIDIAFLVSTGIFTTANGS